MRIQDVPVQLRGAPIVQALCTRAEDRTPEQWEVIDLYNWGTPLTVTPSDGSDDRSAPRSAR